MAEAYYAGVYWLSRSESAGACARRAEALFRLLGQCDPAWKDWYETADSFEEARKREFKPRADAFQEMFGAKENQIGDSFHFRLWTGDNPKETTQVDGFCGSADPIPPSACVMIPPHHGPTAARVLTAECMTAALRAMALAWEPDWGVATSSAHQGLITKGSSPDTFVGWVMYFSRQRGVVPPLPAPVRIELVEDKGTLVILTPERFTASNPEHVALAARVQERLATAGVLGPFRTLSEY